MAALAIQCCFQYYYVLLVVVSLQRPYFFFRVVKKIIISSQILSYFSLLSSSAFRNWIYKLVYIIFTCFDSSDIGGRSLSSPNGEMHRIIQCKLWYYTMQQFMVLYLKIHGIIPWLLQDIIPSELARYNLVFFSPCTTKSLFFREELAFSLKNSARSTSKTMSTFWQITLFFSDIPWICIIRENQCFSEY